MEDNASIAVMFSGGTDSSYAVLTQLAKHSEVRLVSFIRRGLRRIENPDPVVHRFREKFPQSKIAYDQVAYDHIYETITPHEEKLQAQQAILKQEIGPLWEDAHGAREGREGYDNRRISLFMMNECLQCKIAMHIAAIRYCNDNGVTHLCDGGNIEQLDDASQLEDVKHISEEIFRSHGIQYSSPALHVSADERCRALYEAGVTDHLNHKKLEKNHKIPSNQIQCTVPASVLWTVCIFPWLVYDGTSCQQYVDMCCNYYQHEMERWLNDVPLEHWRMPLIRRV